MLQQNIMPSQEVIQYNRSLRTWQLAQGDTVTNFGSGKQAKTMARLVELGMADEALLNHVLTLADGDETLTRRLLDASDLLRAGLVYKNDCVGSQTEPGKVYQCRFSVTYYCECESFTTCPVWLDGYGDCCKHSLACHLAYLTGAILEDAPIPFDGSDGDAVELPHSLDEIEF